MKGLLNLPVSSEFILNMMKSVSATIHMLLVIHKSKEGSGFRLNV